MENLIMRQVISNKVLYRFYRLCWWLKKVSINTVQIQVWGWFSYLLICFTLNRSSSKSLLGEQWYITETHYIKRIINIDAAEAEITLLSDPSTGQAQLKDDPTLPTMQLNWVFFFIFKALRNANVCQTQQPNRISVTCFKSNLIRDNPDDIFKIFPNLTKLL